MEKSRAWSNDKRYQRRITIKEQSKKTLEPETESIDYSALGLEEISDYITEDMLEESTQREEINIK